MKKILFVYHASNIGGGTYCLLNILKEIDRKKFQPLVLLREDGDLVTEIRKLDIDVKFMPTMTLVPYNKSLWRRGVLKSYLKVSKSFYDFDSWLKTLEPDAVYFNTMMLAPYLIIAKRYGCKTAIHLREHWPVNEHIKQLNKIQKIISDSADEIVAINEYSASMVPKRDVTIVYDWIDLTNRFENYPLDEIFGEDTSKLKVYLFTGGLQDIKGAAEVVGTFVNRIKDSEKRLLILGVSPTVSLNGIRNKIRYILSKIGVNVYEYRVRKLIASDDRIVCMPATYSINHIFQQSFCNLSFFTIPHANLALAESIILGTIPVAARTSESLEYSHNGELAVLFELGNSDDMFDKLNYLDLNYDRLKTKIAKQKYLIEEKFDKHRNVAILNSVLEKLF